jgi:hypothetical protein
MNHGPTANATRHILPSLPSPGRCNRPGLGFDSLDDDFDEAADELEEMRAAFERREARTIALERENARLGAEITAWHDSALRLESGPKPFYPREMIFSFFPYPHARPPPFPFHQTQRPRSYASELVMQCIWQTLPQSSATACVCGSGLAFLTWPKGRYQF